MKKIIPKSFKLFGTTINIHWDNVQLNHRQMYGLFNHSSSTILLSDELDGERVNEDVILDTFYHERTHAILDMMNETELSENEKFVDVFSKLLRQADETEILNIES